MNIFSAKYYFTKFNSNINITAYIKLYIQPITSTKYDVNIFTSSQ